MENEDEMAIEPYTIGKRITHHPSYDLKFEQTCYNPCPTHGTALFVPVAPEDDEGCVMFACLECIKERLENLEQIEDAYVG